MIRDSARFITLGGLFLLAFLVPLIVTNSLFFPFITGKNFFFRIVTEIIFASWIILACYDARYRPQFSYILTSILALLGVMFFADIFGVSPHKSFWSNYERMDGYVMLAHLGLYFIVAGAVLVRERFWNAFWNVSLAAATVTMFYGFCQLSGSSSCPISQSDFRIDGHIGNAAYLAIYMLFHVFIALLLFVRSTSLHLKAVYGLLSLGFIFTLAQTATRGTMLALFGGAFLTAAYIALFERGNQFMRKVAIGAVLVVILCAGVLYSAKDSEFIAKNGILNRLSSVSLEEGQTRFTIWSLAWEGVKERPILGWGQENFNYVFNKHYEAHLYTQEPWFDRVHNIVFDWLIAGGILGFLAYFAIIFFALYYVVIRPLWRPQEPAFSVAERGVLLGLIGGYVAHNLLVFDNLISYFFFFSIIAMIHGEFAREIPRIAKARLESATITNIVIPVVGVLLAVSLYFVNVPGIVGAGKLIDAFAATMPDTQLELFKEAFDSNSFAQQEITEQFVRITQGLLSDQSLISQYQNAFRLPPQEAVARVVQIRKAYFTLAEEELRQQHEMTPDDARVLVFESFFYRSTDRPQEAVTTLRRAIELSPQKQQIHFELGLSLAQMEDYAGAHEVFANAFMLEPKNDAARMYYAGSALGVKNRALFDELITGVYKDSYFRNDFILHSAYESGYLDIVQEILLRRIAENPKDLQLRVSYAFTFFEAGNRARAIELLEQAIRDFPSFEKDGKKYIEQVRTEPIPKR